MYVHYVHICMYTYLLKRTQILWMTTYLSSKIYNATAINCYHYWINVLNKNATKISFVRNNLRNQFAKFIYKHHPICVCIQPNSCYVLDRCDSDREKWSFGVQTAELWNPTRSHLVDIQWTICTCHDCQSWWSNARIRTTPALGDLC